jgi:integrase
MRMYTGPHFNRRHGVWFIKFRSIPEGKRTTKNVPAVHQTVLDATAWADDWHVRYIRGGGRVAGEVTPAYEVKTIRSLSVKFLEFRDGHPKCASTTHKSYRDRTKNQILTQAIADKDITTLTAHDYRGLVQHWAKNMAANSCHNCVTVLTTLFKDARGEGWVTLAELPTNPMLDEIVREVLPKQQNTSGRGLVIHVPEAELQTFLACESTRITTLRKVRHRLQVSTGAREGEMCGLLWKWLFLDAPIPHVRIEQQFNTESEVAPPKKDSYRTIPLHPETTLALKWWLAKGWPRWVGKEPQGDDAVFPGTDGHMTRPRSAEYVRYDLVVAGLSDTYEGHNLDAHSLRRSFGTMMSDRKVPKEVRVHLMGHAPEGVTDKLYTHRNLAGFKDAIYCLRFPSWVEPTPDWVENFHPTITSAAVSEAPHGFTKSFDGSASAGGSMNSGEFPGDVAPEVGQESALAGEQTDLSTQFSTQPLDLSTQLDPNDPEHVAAVMRWLSSAKKSTREVG